MNVKSDNLKSGLDRSFKSKNRRRTGNASSARMLRTILAETPLVRNLENTSYMKTLFSGKTTLEEVFAEIEIQTFRQAFRDAQNTPEKIPAKI